MSKNFKLLHANWFLSIQQTEKISTFFPPLILVKKKNHHGFFSRVLEVSSTMTERNYYADVCSYSESSLVLSHRSALAPRFPASLPSYEEEFISQDAPVPAHWKKKKKTYLQTQAH
jgi:hypothetical protein